MRGLLSFCVKYAIFIKVNSLMKNITFKHQKGINSLSKMCTNHNQCLFSDFPPSNTDVFKF